MLTKFSFLEEDLVLSNNSMKFWDFPDISENPKILSFNSFGNLWGNSYIDVGGSLD